MDNWDLTPDRKLKLVPLLAWEAALSPNLGLLRISFARTENHLKRQEIEHLQIGLSAKHARALAEELQHMAEALEANAAAGA